MMWGTVSSRTQMPRPTRSALPRSQAARRRRRRRLLVPLAAVVLIGGGVTAYVLVTRGNDGLVVAQQYADAYGKGDDAAMYALLTAADRRTYPQDRFADIQNEAREISTTQKVRTGTATPGKDGVYVVPVVVETRLFGPLRANLELSVVDDGGTQAVDWSQRLAFPGLKQGEQLSRTTELPPRADILARDGTVMAKGADRTPTSDAALASIVGSLGPIPDELKGEYERAGVPADAKVGLNGLERIFDARLRGMPGGTLRAGDRVLASTEPREATAVRTSIAPAVQRAAVTALAGRYGGIAAIRPGSGQILALAGAAFSGLQPPGSTFKIVTAAGALRYDLAKPSTVYPVETSATLSGVELQNADGEMCGGTLVASFAHSCNSVFGPLGAELGPERLVGTAEDFGFNQPIPIPGAATSTLPSAAELGDDDLVLGSTAIGQGKVQATALQMAIVAATIAMRGERPTPTASSGSSPKREQVIPRQVATEVAAMMSAVVTNGTGGSAAVPGVKTAGKTGTAELRSTQGDCDPANPPADGCPDKDDKSDTTAWFAGFAPFTSPRVAVAVQLPGQGQGGDSAAPAFRDVATAALKNS